MGDRAAAQASGDGEVFGEYVELCMDISGEVDAKGNWMAYLVKNRNERQKRLAEAGAEVD